MRTAENRREKEEEADEDAEARQVAPCVPEVKRRDGVEALFSDPSLAAGKSIGKIRDGFADFAFTPRFLVTTK